MKMKEITYSDYLPLKKYFNNQRYMLCVYTLPSLIAWSNEYYKPYGIIEKDALIIAAEFTEQKEYRRHLILPISPSREYSPEELCRVAEKCGFDNYWFVPGNYIDTFGKKEVESYFKITLQKEYCDYVYLKSDISELKGNRYSQKRNLIHQFEREYIENNRVETGKIIPRLSAECIDFLEKWCIERDCDADVNEDLACEKNAIINTLNHIDMLDMEGIYLRINGEICAFAIAAYLTNDMGVLHFEKAFTNIKGLYQYFDKLCANSLFDGYTYINKESDMNIPGLAKVKQSYHPAMIIKSYRLDLK
ncbi:DUF2156 domain-containing protein [Desulfobacterium sp. N47]